MKDLFETFDADNDGRIDKEEFHRSMKAHNVPIGMREVDILFHQVNTNCNPCKVQYLQ